MVLLLNSLKEKHSVLQVAIIFAAYQFAGTAGALVGGNVMTIFGLRSTLMAALALQATATAAFIPMRHAHKSFGTALDVHPHKPDLSIAAATAYATVVQLFNGLARVLVRLGTRTLPRLVTPDVKRSASRNSAGRSERGLMWKSAMVNGGRTFVRGSGFFFGGALLSIGFTNSLVVLAIITIPSFFVVFFVLPDVVGRAGATRSVSWKPRELFCFSRGVTVTTVLLLLQNAAQFAWLQVPLTTLLRNKTFGAFKVRERRGEGGGDEGRGGERRGEWVGGGTESEREEREFFFKIQSALTELCLPLSFLFLSLFHRCLTWAFRRS